MLLNHAQGMVFRPPSEANSFILRITLGCSHNACTFCAMYRGIQFRTRPLEEIRCIVENAAQRSPDIRRVFLGDGNALVLPTKKLLSILAGLREAFPKLTRVTCYGGPKDILRKTPEELKALKEAGLKIIYLGVESGDDEVLAGINKGVGAAEMVAAGRKVLAAGIKLSVMVILGLGGKTGSYRHATGTARVISHISPTMLSTLTLTLYDGTTLKEAADRGDFLPLTPYETMVELKELICHIRVANPCIFRSDHISNLLPLAGVLNRDRDKMLQEIHEILDFLKDKHNG
ncbi:radical SAM protein [Desulforamulus profundi]|uniref:Radical SAM protein n=2 Tax=Desulforamulus TaxID=2916693 RepID=A0A2C6MA13_9FIRM|nr:radical SAM protein [Desulforamulus profundi]PHJ38009.1 radical SAM protein [Desulforamulus profundi]